MRFDLRALLDKVRRLPAAVDGVSISVPFLSVTVKPAALERTIAREVVIRLADRRVLNSHECCLNCTREALRSIQEIRGILVDKQVQLADHANGPLYLLMEVMVAGIRQFLTLCDERDAGTGRDEQFRGEIEMLRAHLFMSLVQVAAIAHVDIPHIAAHMRYEAWRLQWYEPPGELPGDMAAPSRGGTHEGGTTHLQQTDEPTPPAVTGGGESGGKKEGR